MDIRSASFVLFLMLFGGISPAQDCGSFTVTVSEDTTVCLPGQPVLLSSSFSYPPYAIQWSPPNGLESPAVAATIAAPTVSQSYTVSAQAIGENLIFNGDFELGGLGFTTDYSPGSGGPNGPLHNEGEYLISDNPNATHQDFAACGDHTSGNGNMMVVNSSGQQNDIWCQVVSVAPGTDYAFSAWVASVTEENPANLQFSFDGVLQGSAVEAPPVNCLWTPFYSNWYSGGSTAVNICISNVNEASSGNDFAIDDIRFGPVCEVSAEVNVLVETAPTPVAEVACHATAESIQLSWAPVAGAGSYILDVLDGPSGVFLSDTSYLISGLTENQEVNYELFAVSENGCLSPAFSGNCFSLSCPEYNLLLQGEEEQCEGNILELELIIGTGSSGPFQVEFSFGGTAGTLTGLQAGSNTIAIPPEGSGTFTITSFLDTGNTGCFYGEAFPSVDITSVAAASAGVGEDLSICATTDSLLALNGFLAGADPGGSWQFINVSLPEGVLNDNTGLLNVSALEEPDGYEIGYIQDNGVCPADTAFINLEVLPLPVAEAGGNFSLDCGQTSVTVGATAVPDLAYAWVPLGNGALSNPSVSSPEVSAPGRYALQVTDVVSGCTNADTAEVVDNRPDLNVLLSLDRPGCNGIEEGQIRVEEVAGGQSPYLFSLNGGVFQQSPVFESLAAGEYTLEVQDAEGCTMDTSVVLEDPIATDIRLVAAGFGGEPVIGQGDSISLEVRPEATGSVLPDSLIWSPPVCDGCSEVVVSPGQTTGYSVAGLFNDGCTVTATLLVRVEDEVNVYVPNVFSPNSDGANDRLVPYTGTGAGQRLHFRVYNRWGALVYELKDFEPGTNTAGVGWDGTFLGQDAPDGLYGYHLALERSDGGIITEQSGEVSLIR